MFSATEFWFWFDEPGAPVTSMPESVTLKVDATGGITATLYSCAFWGNSPETMVAQLVAEEFDCDPHDVVDRLPGQQERPARDRARRLAHHGHARRRRRGRHGEDQGEGAAGPPRTCWRPTPTTWSGSTAASRSRACPSSARRLAEIAIMLHLFKHSFPEDMESGLEDSKVFDHPYTTMPSADRKDLGVFYPFMGHACHMPVVEVDIETGARDVPGLRRRARLRHAGEPPLAGRAHLGGTAQGIGTALYEEFVYDDDGQLLTSSYLDYLIPTAMEVPELRIGHHETPSPYTLHGIKGGGEGGRMMAPAAINVAVNDALAPLGVRVTELPMTPERLPGGDPRRRQA